MKFVISNNPSVLPKKFSECPEGTLAVDADGDLHIRLHHSETYPAVIISNSGDVWVCPLPNEVLDEHLTILPIGTTITLTQVVE